MRTLLGQWRPFLRRIRRHRLGLLGGCLLGFMILAAVFAPWITRSDPTYGQIRNRLIPPIPLEGSSWEHPLGTDQLGRDVLARILYGARISLIVSVLSTVLGGILGTLLGLISGFYKGLVDTVIMRISDIQMSFPFLALAIAVVAVVGPGLKNLIFVLAFGSWVLFTRIVRVETRRLMDREFVSAARASGATDARIMLRHIFPNIVPSVIVIATFSFAQMIILESSLSFLGLGVQPPIPSWGGMLSDSRSYLQIVWWLPIIPGFAILFTVLGMNLFGDALRDILDPHLRNLDG